jgi:hypothetical protein
VSRCPDLIKVRDTRTLVFSDTTGTLRDTRTLVAGGLMPGASESRYVTLRGGLALPLAPLLLALDLEARGFRLEADGDVIIITPYSRLTDEDRRQLTLWKPHVLALLGYHAPEVG